VESPADPHFNAGLTVWFPTSSLRTFVCRRFLNTGQKQTLYNGFFNAAGNNKIFIVDMMREIENLTMVNNTRCVSFREKNVPDPYFITIFNGSGCYAPVNGETHTESGCPLFTRFRSDRGAPILLFVVFL
jgi:hypothetical protein